MIPQVLMPPPQYRDMAQAVLNNAAGIHEYLNACEACGLPVQDRRDTLNAQCEFCKAFIQQFWPEHGGY